MKVDKQTRRLGRRMLQVYQECDPIATEGAKRMAATCSEGCAHCCHLLTVITLPEAVAIAEYLLNDLSWQARLPTLLKVLYEQLKALEDPELTRESYFAQQIPCVFLGKDNRCGIYKVRPTACRYHYVVTDPKNCGKDAENTTVGRIDLRSLELHAMSEGARVSKQVGVMFSLAPLQVMVLWALKLASEGPSVYDQLQIGSELGVMSLHYWIDLITGETALAKSLLASADTNGLKAELTE